jgi:hypothetical protein
VSRTRTTASPTCDAFIPICRVKRGALNRWPTGYGDCIGTLGPREGPSPRTPEGGRRGAAAGRWSGRKTATARTALLT